MVWRKLTALMLGLLIMGMTLSMGSVSAATTSAGVTVILVSDNAADSAIASYLANLTGAYVVTTRWGTYSPNVTAEILSRAPDRVIIIGGPEAVVEQYVADLKEYNITVYRWWGKNRYETNLAVIGNVTKLFGLNFNSMVIVAGNDSAAIQEALKIAVQNRSAIVYVNSTMNLSRVMKEFRFQHIVIVQSEVSKMLMRKLVTKLIEHIKTCNCTATSVQVNVSERQILRLMEQVRKRVWTIERIANMTNATQLMEQVSKMEQLMALAKQCISQGNYTRAYLILLKLQVRTEFALKECHTKFEEAIKHCEELALEIELARIGAQIRVMEKAGINVSAVEPLLKQLKRAIEKGDYTQAKLLLQEIKRSIHEAYRGSKALIREVHRKRKEGHSGRR